MNTNPWLGLYVAANVLCVLVFVCMVIRDKLKDGYEWYWFKKTPIRSTLALIVYIVGGFLGFILFHYHWR